MNDVVDDTAGQDGSRPGWWSLLPAGSGKIFGVLGLLVVTCFATSQFTPYFLTAYNIENLLRRTSLFGVISIGAAFVIMVGGIDLSIGSVIALVGCLLPRAWRGAIEVRGEAYVCRGHVASALQRP